MGLCSSSKNTSDMDYSNVDLPLQPLSSFSRLVHIDHDERQRKIKKRRTRKKFKKLTLNRRGRSSENGHTANIQQSDRAKRKRSRYGDWNRLCALPTRAKTLAPILLNEEQFIIIQTTLLLEGEPIFYIYSCADNSYTHLTKYPTNYPSGYLYTASLDQDSMNLYLLMSSLIITYNLNTNEWRKYELNTSFDCGNDPCSVSINDHFHVIGVDEHLIWNHHTLSLTQNTLPYSLEYFDKPTVIYHKQQQQLLLIGQEFNLMTKEPEDSVYSYSLKEKLWKKLDLILPHYSTGCILNGDQSKLLLFGGQYMVNTETNLDNIYVIEISEYTQFDDDDDNKKNDHNLDNLITFECMTRCKMKKSRVKCPTEALFFALTTSNRLHEKWIVNWFIEQCWKNEVKDDQVMMRIPSMDIVDMICRYYAMCYVHLIDKYNGNQWRICLNEIERENNLQNCDYHTVANMVGNVF